MINNVYSKSASLALLALAVGYGVFAGEIPLDFWSLEEPINARTLPYLLAITGTILALALSVLSFLPDNANVSTEKIPSTQSSDWRSLCLMLVLMAAFAISIELMGFVLSSITADDWICAYGEQISSQNIIDCHTSCAVNLAHTGCARHLSGGGDNVPDNCAGSQRLEPCLTASYWA